MLEMAAGNLMKSLTCILEKVCAMANGVPENQKSVPMTKFVLPVHDGSDINLPGQIGKHKGK